MSTNTELARIFNEMAAILEVTGANVFRANAHTKLARILRAMPDDIAKLASAENAMEQLTAIDGIGDGSAKKIIEYVQTGRIKEHEELLEKIPPGLLEVMTIPGLGPKTVRTLWEKAGVTDMASLQSQLDSGELEKLPRMGAKTVANIRESIAFAAKSAERVRLGVALPVAEAIVAHLQEHANVSRVAYAGSLRRGRETIGDIDILASSEDPASVTEVFIAMEGVEKILASGETKCSLRLETGIQVDLRIVPEPAFGAALLYFTGSKEHNVRLRERAIKRGFRLNEYGLFPMDEDDEPPQKRGVDPIASAAEVEIYEALELPYIPPELREDSGEFDRDIPADLVTLDDIKAELHTHTFASDGHLTIEEHAAYAKKLGFHTVAITDHSRSSVQANGLDADRLREHIAAVREANENVKGVTLLAGSEVDILTDGRLDYDDDLLAELDIVVASPHAALKQKPDIATKRLLAAIRHPLVHILGHPTGRVIGRRPGLSPDISALIEAAVEHDVALEINANYMRLDLRDYHVRAAVEAGAKIAINTDAHSTDDYENLRFGVLTARRGWLTSELCINAWPAKKLHQWLRSKR